MQRDLLAGIDYVGDPDAWLFSWDDLNPDCAISGSTVSDTNRQGEKEDIKEGRYGLGKVLGKSLYSHPARVFSFLLVAASFVHTKSKSQSLLPL